MHVEAVIAGENGVGVLHLVTSTITPPTSKQDPKDATSCFCRSSHACYLLIVSSIKTIKRSVKGDDMEAIKTGHLPRSAVMTFLPALSRIRAFSSMSLIEMAGMAVGLVVMVVSSRSVFPSTALQAVFRLVRGVITTKTTMRCIRRVTTIALEKIRRQKV